MKRSLSNWIGAACEMAPACVGYLAVVTACAGIVYGGDRLIRPEPAHVHEMDTPAAKQLLVENHRLRTAEFNLRRQVLDLELERNGLLRELSRQPQGPQVAQPDVLPGDLIPATALPTK